MRGTFLDNCSICNYSATGMLHINRIKCLVKENNNIKHAMDPHPRMTFYMHIAHTKKFLNITKFTGYSTLRAHGTLEKL